MSNTKSSNIQIAKNSIFLYFRQVVTMLLSLYTSRVLLHTLGVDDLGLYGLVGGIVAMFASLKTMFTVSVQRFLNIEIGNGNDRDLSIVFNVSVLVNIAIAVFFLVVVEMGGLWLIENKLHISQERMVAANWVFQLSVIAAIVQIFNVPFDADIIARERMNVFALVSVFDAFAKLIIVLLLPFFGGDRLIIYSLLMLFVICMNFFVNVLYCHFKFPESHLLRFPFPEIKVKFKEMFAFSSWAFFGNVIFALVNEGINVLLNIFGNLAANAARTITYQVRSVLSNVVSNVYIAVKPQTIQSYARKEMDRFYKLMFMGGKVVGYMYLLLAIPLFFTLNEILFLWLGTVPNYAIGFLSACLLYQFVRVLHQSVGMFFIAIGKLKRYQITEFFVLGSALPLSYIGLKYFEMPLYWVFLVMAFSELMNLFAILLLAKKIGNFEIKLFFENVLLPYGMMGVLCLFSAFLLKCFFSLFSINVILKTFAFIAVVLIVQVLLLFFIGFRKEERNLFVSIVHFKRK